MMFAHGFGCDQNMWRHVSPAFEDKFRIVLFDHVGAGGSDLEAYDPVKYSTLMLDAARNEGLSELQISDASVPLVRPAIAGIAALTFTFRVKRLLLVTGAGAIGRCAPAHRRPAVVARHVAHLVATDLGGLDRSRDSGGADLLLHAAALHRRAHRRRAERLD